MMHLLKHVPYLNSTFGAATHLKKYTTKIYPIILRRRAGKYPALTTDLPRLPRASIKEKH